MKDEKIIRIPVVGHMVRQADGSYILDRERSVYADIPADAVVDLLVRNFGGIVGDEALDAIRE